MQTLDEIVSESPAMAGSGGLAEGVRESTRLREAYFLEYAKEIRAVTKLPLLLTGGMRTAKTMNDVVASGAVDVVGLARPLTAEPDLPRRLLENEDAAAAASVRPIGIKKLDDMLQVLWFQQQLHRMADGLEPDPTLGRWTALFRGIRHTIFASSKPAPALPERSPVTT